MQYALQSGIVVVVEVGVKVVPGKIVVVGISGQLQSESQNAGFFANSTQYQSQVNEQQ